MLEWAEIDFDVLVEETPETFPVHLSVDEVPVHIAREKAKAVRASAAFEKLRKNIPVLAADTIVVLNERIIGKPVDRTDAIGILTDLSGKKHRVITGVVITDGEKEISFSDITDVEFNALEEIDIAFYVDKYRPYDKAGAYAIQEWIGMIGIEKINGDYYNVMGLPIGDVVKVLHRDFDYK